MLKWDTIIVPHARIAARVVAGQALILDPRNDALQRLNEVGSFIWAKVAERRHTLNEITQSVVEEFDAHHDTIRADLERFVTELFDRDCIDYIHP